MVELNDNSKVTGAVPDDINAYNEYGMTPLQVAAQALDPDKVREYLDLGAEVTKLSRSGDRVEFFLQIGAARNDADPTDAATAHLLISEAREKSRFAPLTDTEKHAIATASPSEVPFPTTMPEANDTSFWLDRIKHLNPNLAEKLAANEPILINPNGEKLGAAEVSAAITRGRHGAQIPTDDTGKDWIVAIDISVVSEPKLAHGPKTRSTITTFINNDLDREQALWLGARAALDPKSLIHVEDLEKILHANPFTRAYADDYAVRVGRHENFLDSNIADLRHFPSIRGVMMEHWNATDIGYDGGEDPSLPITPFYQGPPSDITPIRDEVLRQTFQNPDKPVHSDAIKHGRWDAGGYIDAREKAKNGDIEPAKGEAVFIDIPGAPSPVTGENFTRYVIGVGLAPEERNTIVSIMRADPTAFIKPSEGYYVGRNPAPAYRPEISVVDLIDTHGRGETPLAGANYADVNYARLAAVKETFDQATANNQALSREYEATMPRDEFSLSKAQLEIASTADRLFIDGLERRQANAR